MKYYIPSRMKQNYDDFLKTDICHTLYYCKDTSDSEQKWVSFRGEISPINFKSKQYSSDNSFNLRFSLDEDIQKGDVILYDNQQYLVTWQVNKDKLDSKKSIIELMPYNLTFRRKSLGKPKVDSKTGNIIEQSKDNTVCVTRAMNVSGSHLELRLKTGQPGLFAASRFTITVQANANTKKIAVDDYFNLMGSQYVIRDILYNQLNYDSETGLIIFEVDKGIVNNEI